MTTLTWLHLSDWHQKRPEFGRHVVGEALLKDIRERECIDPTLARVDFIVFSGDLAFSGKPAEYEAARRELLDPLLETLNLTTERLFLVPGNHDVDRERFKFLPAGAPRPVTSEEQMQKIIDEWLEDPEGEEGLKSLLLAFSSYNQFALAYTRQPTPDYASFRVWEFDNKLVALVGLNSAWMCAHHREIGDTYNDYGFALVGEPQIDKAFTNLEKELKERYEARRADLHIAVLHHPFEWLFYADRFRVRAEIRKRTEFVLSGHEHCPEVEISQGTLGKCIAIPAGASYQGRLSDHPRHINAYNFVYFDLEDRSGIVYLRRWDESRREWQPDYSSYTNGKYPFSFDKTGEGE